MHDAGYLPGERLGDYRIVRLLGRGGYADVYQAVHVVNEDVVALKCLRPHHMENARAKERLLAEARLFSVLRHANVVRVTHVGSDRGAVWMAMEFLEGGTLRDVAAAAHGALPIVKVLYFGREIADGIAALHDMRVVHRDLKPENIMVTAKGAVKVLDAGAGKFFGWDVQSTGPLGAVGTPLYMAPEHIMGETVDGRTDVYALGLILYELFTGFHPFARDPERLASQFDVITWQLHAVPPPLGEVVRGFPPSISALVERAMAKKPTDRHGSMTELAQAIRVEWQRWLRECPGDPERVGAFGGAIGEAAPGSPERQADPASLSPAAGSEARLPVLLAAERPLLSAIAADDAVTVEIRREMASETGAELGAAAARASSFGAQAKKATTQGEPSSRRLPPNGTEPITSGPWSRSGGLAIEGAGVAAPAIALSRLSAAPLPATAPLPSASAPSAALFRGAAPRSGEPADRPSFSTVLPPSGAAINARPSLYVRTRSSLAVLCLVLGVAMMAVALVLILRRPGVSDRTAVAGSPSGEPAGDRPVVFAAPGVIAGVSAIVTANAPAPAPAVATAAAPSVAAPSDSPGGEPPSRVASAPAAPRASAVASSPIAALPVRSAGSARPAVKPISAGGARAPSVKNASAKPGSKPPVLIFE